MCTYLWPDNEDMRPSFWFLCYVHLFYPLLFKSEHFSYGRILICHTYCAAYGAERLLTLVLTWISDTFFSQVFPVSFSIEIFRRVFFGIKYSKYPKYPQKMTKHLIKNWIKMPKKHSKGKEKNWPNFVKISCEIYKR